MRKIVIFIAMSATTELSVSEIAYQLGFEYPQSKVRPVRHQWNTGKRLTLRQWFAVAPSFIL